MTFSNERAQSVDGWLDLSKLSPVSDPTQTPLCVYQMVLHSQTRDFHNGLYKLQACITGTLVLILILIFRMVSFLAKC